MTAVRPDNFQGVVKKLVRAETQEKKKRKEKELEDSMVDGKIKVFTSRKLTDYNLKPPEQMKLGKANYVSILKRK